MSATAQGVVDRGQGPGASVPDFREIPHDGCVPTFRLATWRGIRAGTLGVGSTNRRAFLRVRASMDVGRLREATARLLVRHPVLTSNVATRVGSPLLMLGQCNPDEPVWFDLSAVAAQDRVAEAVRQAGEFTWRPFDLQSGPLLRVLLMRLGRNDHVFGFAVHHLVSDAVSCSRLLEELWNAYRASAPGDGRATGQHALRYEHYLLATNEWLREPAGQSALRRYAHQVAGGTRTANADGERLESALAFDAELSKRLANVAVRRQSTMFLLLVAAVAALEARDDVVTIGGVVNGREDPRFHAAIGYFSDRVYWSIDASGDPTFAELLQRVRRATAAVLPFRYVRSDHLLEYLGAQGRPFAAPMLNYRAVMRDTSAPTSAAVERFEVAPPAFRSNPGPAIPFWISLVDSGAGISGSVNGAADAVPRFVQRLGAVLRQIAAADTIRLSNLVQP